MTSKVRETAPAAEARTVPGNLVAAGRLTRRPQLRPAAGPKINSARIGTAGGQMAKSGRLALKLIAA